MDNQIVSSIVAGPFSRLAVLGAILLAGCVAMADTKAAPETATGGGVTTGAAGPEKPRAEEIARGLWAEAPDFTVLSTDERAWIEQACPRVIGPASWKRCAGRNLEALKAATGSRTPTKSAAKAGLQSTKGAGVGAVRAQPVPATGGERATIAETTPATARSVATVSEKVPKLPKDPAPHLPKPADNERWLCTSGIFGRGPEREPSIVLTRETPRNQPEGRGKVAVAGVVHEAVFRVEGVSRRWDWNTNADAIVIRPDGRAAYYNFRGLGLFETKTKPSELLTCVQG